MCRFRCHMNNIREWLFNDESACLHTCKWEIGYVSVVISCAQVIQSQTHIEQKEASKICSSKNPFSFPMATVATPAGRVSVSLQLPRTIQLPILHDTWQKQFVPEHFWDLHEARSSPSTNLSSPLYCLCWIWSMELETSTCVCWIKLYYVLAFQNVTLYAGTTSLVSI